MNCFKWGCGLRLIPFFCLILTNYSYNALAQSYTSLTFTGKSSLTQENIPLHHIEISNLTQHWEEGLQYPDTILQFGGVGISKYEDNLSVLLLQNNPNPFDGITDFTLQLEHSTQILLEVYDLSGRKAIEYAGYFSAGQHLFRATLSSPQTYLLSATAENGRMSIKMINKGTGTNNSLTYLGALTTKEIPLKLNSNKGMTPLPFMLGDEMVYAGHLYADGNDYTSQIVQQRQWGTEVITLFLGISSAKVHTQQVTNVDYYTAVCGGDVTHDGSMNVTARGVCWDTSPNPTLNNAHTTDGTGTGIFTSSLTGLTQNTTYYVRAFATNGLGTVYGEELSFATLQASTPTVTTSPVSDVSFHTATCGGLVSSSGGLNVTTRGVCWNTESNPTLNDSHTTNGGGIGTFTSSLTNLTDGTTYYVRAYATNSAGTAYGEEKIFTTPDFPDGDAQPCPGTSTITDIDGNIYNTVKIGTQCWMRENLKTTKYADGVTIPYNSSSASSASWYYPNNSSANKPTYGLLYNWKAVMRDNTSSNSNPSGIQGICPTGWHVPSNLEWAQLINYVSGQNVYVCEDSHIAKALASTTGWNSISSGCAVGNNLTSNNITGFNAMPAGIYDLDNNYSGLGTCSYFWSTTGNGSYFAGVRYLSYNYSDIYSGNDAIWYGHSVRCIRNEGQEYNPPTVTTTSVTITSASTATGNGEVTDGGGADVTVRGVCWSTSHNPTVNDSHTTGGSGIGSFTCNITGLAMNTTYYVKAYATNSLGTAYGEEVSIIISPPSGDGQPCPNAATVTDRDGNSYNTVKIGTQCWMKENLRTTKYADGTSIAQGNDFSETTGYWYYPDNNANNKPIYGLLYNWKAVMRNSISSDANPSGVQGICPTGWHVPSDAEWAQLTNYLSGHVCYICYSDDNNSIAKSLASSERWVDYSDYSHCAVGYMQGNNATGFNALPAGDDDIGHNSITRYAFFHSSTEYENNLTWERYLYYGYEYMTRANGTKSGKSSVRCIRN